MKIMKLGLSLLGLILLSLLYQPFIPDAAGSPIFARQEIKDPSLDWIDLRTYNSTKDGGETLSDIGLVNYFSNGKTLNAILWLNFPVVEEPPSDELSYGMLIDADANVNTGVRGVDYIMEIKWTNNNWTKTFRELSSHGESRTLIEDIGYKEFFDEKKRFVTLSVDLESMGSPDIYKVAFFTHEISNKDSHPEGVADFSKWVHVPAPDFIISTQPSSVVIKAGEEQTIEVFVESTSVFEPEVILSADRTENFTLRFSPNRFNIPSHGLASTALNIKIPQTADDRPYTFLIIADATFPTEPSESQILKSSFIKIPDLEGETVTKKSRLTITVEPPIPLFEKFYDFATKADGIITLAISAGTIINGIFAFKYKKEKSKNTTK